MRTTIQRPSRPESLRRGALAAASVATVLALAACSGGSEESGAAEDAGTTTDSSAVEEAGSPGRVAVSYEGGILVLDGESLEVLADAESEEFTRLNPAGDGRHVMVTMSEGFQLLDTAAGADGEEPQLTETVFEADTPGHVVSHAGKTVLYADGTSDTTIMEAADIAGGEMPETEVVEGEDAHHGVSLVLEDGSFLTTVGDSESRSGAVVRDADGETIAETDECPGVHGEGTAADEVVVLGCEDGVLVYSDGAFEKLDAPDQPYGRMGNVFVTDSSPLVLGDYNRDQDAEGYLLDAVTITDTEAMTYDVVEMPEGAQYTFRDLARGPEDLGYVLATDGAIHVIDPETREFTDAFPVVEPWEGPAEWQDPHPTIKVEGDRAFVTEPASQEVHVVDLTSGEVLQSTSLEVVPNEIAVAAS